MGEDDFIPISALQHYSYCPRQCALIHAEQSFADNVNTARGNATHRVVDIEGYELRAGMRLERALLEEIEPLEDCLRFYRLTEPAGQYLKEYGKFKALDFEGPLVV